MKIVREFLDFDLSGDPMEDMDLGIKARISQWLDMMDIQDYVIKDDLSIDVQNDVNLIGEELEELPEFISFNKIWGGFYAGGNPWQSLRGFPKEVRGDLQINSIANIIEVGEINPKINRNMVKKLIKVHGKIFI
jgi:hypothetical protein